MFPLNDTEPNRYGGQPVMLYTLILANIIVAYFDWFASGGPTLARYFALGTVPQWVVTRQGAGAIAGLTGLFLHGGLLHLGGNMLALWVFGRRVEDACGPWRFLLFYLSAGVGADILFAMASPQLKIPAIGASGAISGVMGAYLLLYPAGRIRTIIFFFGIPTWPRIRAFWIVLLFIALDLLNAYLEFRYGFNNGVANWAHLGGYISAPFILFFLRPAAFMRYRNDLPV